MVTTGRAKKKRKLVGLDFQAQCPCCFKPGAPFCDTCEPEDAAQKLSGLRTLMEAHGLDAYLVLPQDAHSSEYVAPADERRNFLTGFSGSSGTAVVTRAEALVWTDGRYWLQCAEQIKGTEWKMMRQGDPAVPDLREWVLEHLEGKVVGVDPAMVSWDTAEHWKSVWGDRLTLKEVYVNLVDCIWMNKPDDPCNAILVHPLEYAGETVDGKLRRLREALKQKEAQAIVLSALDQVAWLFNMRGSDIECNPVFFAYSVVTTGEAYLFTRALNEGQVGLSEEVQKHLAEAGVKARPYTAFVDEAKAILEELTVWMEPKTSSLAAMGLAPEARRVCGTSPVEIFKSQKNAKEIEGLRRASLRDSLAICELFSLLETRLTADEPEPIDEVQAADIIAGLRAKQPLCVGNSFPTISSTGSNAAVIHYQPVAGACKQLSKDEIYLCDTGGQYLDGTTDITRTVHFGTPTAEQARFYTRVLQGHMALARAVFPDGTPGLMMETLARMFLWQDGLQYAHGTGHGMGAYMNVHEGPMGIGGGLYSGDKIESSVPMRQKYLEPLRVGQYLSDEPGCYKDGDFGIRLESDLLVVPAETPYSMGGRPFLCFEYLTLVPFCRSLIDTALLAPAELAWVNAYHARVRRELQGKLSGATAEEWLRISTEPLSQAASVPGG